MGAFNRDKTQLTTSFEDFYDRVKLICSYKEVEWLGLKPKSISGQFFSDDIDTLKEFCRDNTDYHIVTCTDGTRLENRLILGHQIYLLAIGDKNPQIVVNWSLAPDFHLQLEEEVCEILAVLRDVKNGRKT